MSKTTNLFLSGTEYHFLMCMALIDEYYSGDEFENVIVLMGYRSSQIDVNYLPHNIKSIQLPSAKKFEDILSAIKQISSYKVQNLFIFHLYRTLEAYIVYMMPESTVIHLVEDGALFYHKMEKKGLASRIRMTYEIYKDLFRLRLGFYKLIFYRFHIWNSSDVDVVCMTKPNLFICKEQLKKPIKEIHLFPNREIVDSVERCFDTVIPILNNSLIYLSFKVYNENDALREAEIIKYLLKQTRYDQVLIKLHPASRKFQIDVLNQNFGDAVILNNIPAELYLAKANESDIYGVASTSMFYYNKSCRYFSLKVVCQHLGLYAQWKNVQLPGHVNLIENLVPFINLFDDKK